MHDRRHSKMVFPSVVVTHTIVNVLSLTYVVLWLLIFVESKDSGIQSAKPLSALRLGIIPEVHLDIHLLLLLRRPLTLTGLPKITNTSSSTSKACLHGAKS